MKRLILLSSILLFRSYCAQDFLWTAQGSYFNLSTAAIDPVIDEFGNIYVAGHCNTSGFGHGPLPDTSFGSFLNKYTPEGRLLWSKLSLDYQPRMSINLNLQEIVVTVVSDEGMDLLKYDYNGTLKSRRNLCSKEEGKLAATARGLSIDGNNNCYITGAFTNTALILGQTITNSSVDDAHLFVLKIDSQDNLIWIRTSDKGHIFSHTGIKVNRIGEVCVYGDFLNEIGIAGVSYTAGFNNGFVCKYTSDGVFKWLLNFGAEAGDYVSSLCVNEDDGSLYALGKYGGTFEMTPFKLEIKGKYDSNIFIAKISGNGILMDLKSVGGIYRDAPGAIYYKNNEVFFTGGFKDTTNIGGREYISPENTFESYLAGCDQNLNIKWLTLIGAAAKSEAYAGGLSGDHEGNLIFTGGFLGSIAFGGQAQQSFGRAMYVAKVADRNPLGINAAGFQNNEISVYPVPSSGLVNVSCKTAGVCNVVIEVRDGSGKLFYETAGTSTATDYSAQIKLPDGARGVYYLSLQINGKNVATKQLIR